MKTRERPLILLVDDHPTVRQGLADVLEEAEVGTCCEAGGRDEALAMTDRAAPDMALVDLSLGSDDALALVAELRARHVPVLVCSTYDDPESVKRALAAGARGYLTKGEARQVAQAVRGVLEGWMLVSPRAAEGLEEE